MARAHAGPSLMLLLLSIGSLLSVPLISQASGLTEDLPTWTVMVYMAADAEPELPWEEDINEMESCDLADWIDVEVLIDPLGFGDSMILEIEEDASPDIASPQVDDGGQVIPPNGEVNMASQTTLAEFIVFSASRHPADRLALVLWGHSGGWYGLCQDGPYVLQLPALGTALETATEELGRKIDIVVMDSCAEGVIETMYEIREYVDWCVGSEMNVPAQGLRYDLVLDSLSTDRTISPEAWGAHICEIHMVTLYSQSWSATMAAFDLRALDDFVDRLEELSLGMEGYAGLYGNVLMGVLLQAAETDLVEWYLDVGDVLRRLVDAALPLEVEYMALEALRCYARLVYDSEVYASPFEDNYDQVVNCTGAAVYAPSTDPADEAYWSVAFSSRGWADAVEIIRSGGATTTNSPPPDIIYHDVDEDGEQEEATLQWEADCDLCVAWVFAQTSAGLQLVDRLESTGQNMTVKGYAGELIVSASTWEEGGATSHHELNLVLSQEVEVRVRVISDEEPVTEGIQVRMLTRDGPIDLAADGEDFVGAVRVPADTGYGELVTVQVVDGRGEVLAENRTYVQGPEVTLEVRLYGWATGQPGSELILPSALLAACALAVALYVWGRKRASNP